MNYSFTLCLHYHTTITVSFLLSFLLHAPTEIYRIGMHNTVNNFKQMIEIHVDDSYFFQTPESQASSSSAAAEPTSPSSSGSKPLTQTRIQFKKSDGTSLLHIFDKETLLVDVIKHFQNECDGEMS